MGIAGKRLCAGLTATLVFLTVLLALPWHLPLPASAEDADYTFSSGAVLIDSSYNGKNILIQNGVFSVTVTGATDVNILFDNVTIDRRYSSDSALSGTDAEALYNVFSDASLGWEGTTSETSTGKNTVTTTTTTTYVAQTSPLLITGDSSVTVAFRGTNNFYAGTNGCTVTETKVVVTDKRGTVTSSTTTYTYTPAQSGGGFAGIQVDSGSSLVIADGNGTLNAYGGFYVEGDNSNNYGYGYGIPDGATLNSLAGGAGIGGGVTYNTTDCASSSYTAGTPGNITINGGTINAYGGHEAAGIGGGLNGAATTGSIVINGGTIVAKGGRWSAGIGDGDSLQSNYPTLCNDSYSIVINGGTVSATGGVGCPGIGSTDEVPNSGLEIALNGGTITAFSGYPDGFNPSGSSEYTGTDAAAAIGAGNKTNMQSNSITVASAAVVVASGFGYYAITENGVQQDTLPTVTLDSDGYFYLGRFPRLPSQDNRNFELYEAQREIINGHEYIKFITQEMPDGDTIYYYGANADGAYLLDENKEVVTKSDGTPYTYDELTQFFKDNNLTLDVDKNSVLIKTVTAMKHFRSIALTLPSPEEHGGIYALKVPTASIIDPPEGLPDDYIVVTIGALEKGVISGEIKYPNNENLIRDSVSTGFTDMDAYTDAAHTDGSDGLIGDGFAMNVYAYTVYIEPGDNTVYTYFAFLKEDNVSSSITVNGDSVTLYTQTVDGQTLVYFTYTANMTGLQELILRIKKTDTNTTSGSTANSIVYKLTLIRKDVCEITLNTLSKVYDGKAVAAALQGLTCSGVAYTASEEDLARITFTYYQGTTELTGAPKDAGTYNVKAEIIAPSFNATGAQDFTISKRTVTVSRIENFLVYVLAKDYTGWTAPHQIDDPGAIYLANVVAGDDLTVDVGSAYYNNIDIGYATDKITLKDVTLGGRSAGNYYTETEQTVYGQINYSLDGAIFRKEEGTDKVWQKYYPVDAEQPVTVDDGFHSKKNQSGVFDSHREYILSRTTGEGESGKVYAADIEFGALYFTYSYTAWNPNTLQYEELGENSRWSGFDGTNNCISVTNRSNADISYTVTAKIDFLHSAIGDSTVGITAKLYTDNTGSGTSVNGVAQTLVAAIPGDHTKMGTAQTAKCYLWLTGVPQMGESNYTAVGNLTVALAKSSG